MSNDETCKASWDQFEQARRQLKDAVHDYCVLQSEAYEVFNIYLDENGHFLEHPELQDMWDELHSGGAMESKIISMLKKPKSYQKQLKKFEWEELVYGPLEEEYLARGGK